MMCGKRMVVVVTYTHTAENLRNTVPYDLAWYSTWRKRLNVTQKTVTTEAERNKQQC